ncbi:hypothetical protein FJ987_20740 [Mesorhizobium sp. CU2]|nr:hypothetical protein [Mesorhizobium sp. CU2]TPO10582.1 hypothetical protein FJ987_20740 [Mesorhizobium sp. CU2]
MVERFVARLLEIAEGEFVQLAGQVAGCEERSDEILRPVGGSRVADDPAIDMVGNRAEAALEVRHLVPDDHVEAKPLAVRHPSLDEIVSCGARIALLWRNALRNHPGSVSLMVHAEPSRVILY